MRPTRKSKSNTRIVSAGAHRSRGNIPVDPVNVTIGSAGGTAFVFRAFAVIEFKTEDSFTYREIDRKTHVTRIENPDDPSQFVEVERIDQIALRHKLNPDDKRIYQIKSKD